jgi:hypothetical protein
LYPPLVELLHPPLVEELYATLVLYPPLPPLLCWATSESFSIVPSSFILKPEGINVFFFIEGIILKTVSSWFSFLFAFQSFCFQCQIYDISKCCQVFSQNFCFDWRFKSCSIIVLHCSQALVEECSLLVI